MKYFRSFLRYSPKIMKMETSSTATSQKCIKEGQAEIRLASEKVFYNPVQEFNRDLSIAVLSVFTKDYIEEKLARAAKSVKKSEDIVEDVTGNNSEIPVTVLEALSATGLRSVRYAKEVPNVTKIIANDLSEQAVETIRSNIVHNGVEGLIETSHDDACMVMYKHKLPSKRFAAIDLDPYGCPSIFLDSAVQSVQDGGLLLVTATDMAVLAGNSPETCYCKYGAVSLKTKSCHEMALRILLQCIEQHANRYSRYIVPLLSISADFYIRVFVKIYSGAIHCKKTTSKLSMAFHCVGCDNITLQPLGGFKPNPTEKNPQQMKAFLPPAPAVGEHCVHCNQRHHLGGPIWSDPIHDDVFVTRVLSHVQGNPGLFGTAKRIQGVLAMVREELPDVPLYYTLDKLFGRVHLETMPMLTLRSAILNAGYKVSYSHAAKLSIKTAAPAQVIWDIIRTWEKTHPIKPAKLESDPVAKHILSQDIRSGIDLSERPDANPISRRDGQLRFQFNPTRHWGPGSRAAVNIGEEKISKAIRNQNKYSNKDKTAEKRGHSPSNQDDSHKKSNVNFEQTVM
ncbi:probable tRNA (guanine(26)-N(2))-dimethyltransferase isoform X2 [Pararge aegeria]|uniref:tRNA (guanine(26)-N(2))-dimethyltransferase n=2 Tax=Pararge aegeria TaxID=116150 RepID=A0A8S4RN25_9NEOP|nr:probable tRNA (guanine(26)-N(2))-dimethyltransferase isoform X2 [Pararge aegeria]CAH2238806.1 jg7740 [Pararge aegeria aegeria]